MSDHRHAKIKVSGAPSLQLRSLRGRESLGRIFEFEVDLWGTDPNLKHEDLVGKAATVLMQLPVFGGVKRHFTGVISRFEQSGFDGSFAFYRASLVPWTWLLTRWSTCRILAMNTKASEHIQQILNDHASGMGAVTPRLNFSGYRSWEYCVQYNETTFNFISRLLEQEGIYYFFKHNADGTHDIVLCDGPSSHNEFDLGNIEFRHPGDGDDLKAYIRSWNIETRLQPEFYRVRDWDFLHPQQPVTGTASAENPVVPGDAEIYEYPGEFVAEGEGNQYANVRLQALTAQRSVIRGTTDHPAMAAGMKFTFKPDRHMYRNDQGKAYLVTSASYEIHVSPRVGGEPGSDGPPWACNFTAMDASVQFRTPRTTPKPIVQGPQTAIVTGKSDSEIDADEHGRVTVKFPWDLDPKYDDTSSIRVRVSQAWAGKGWGYLFTPRVGQEVVVEFLEGDPDRPLITGRVYNDENKPPYDPKQFPTISVIKSSSSKGGEGFNELRFEDKKDSEMIWMHAQKRMDIRVRGNYRETNYGNRDVRVGWESSDDSGGSYNILVKEDVNEWIKKGVYEKVDTVHNRTVVEDVVEDFQKNQTTFVKETYQLNAKKIIVEGADLVSHKSKKVLIEGSTQGVSIKSGADMKLTANGVLSLKGGQKIAGEGQMGVSFKGLQVVLEGQTGVTLKVGGNFVAITPAGVDIMGTMVKINSGGSPGGPAAAPGAADPAEAVEAAEICDPLEAAVADDGKPGKVSGTGSGTAPQRTPRTIDPQNAPDSPPYPPPPAPPPPPVPVTPVPPPATDEEWEIEQLIEVYDTGASAQQAANGRKQYINFDRSTAGKWDQGQTIFLKAKLKWKTGDQSRSLAGKKVYWKATPDGSNKTGLIAALKHGFGGTADKVDEQSTVDAQGWTPVVQFKLSKYGGDKFKVEAASDSGMTNKLASGEWEVWRKLFYELDGMVRPGGGSFTSKHDDGRLRSIFAGQFVELVSTGTDGAPAFQRVVTADEANAWASACRDGSGAPRYFHLVYIDTIAWDPVVDPTLRTITPGNGISWDPRTKTMDPRDYFVSAEYRQPAGSGSWSALTKAQCALVELGSVATGDDRPAIFPDFTGTGIDMTQQVEVRLQTRHYTEGSGLQTGPATIVGMRWRERAYSGAILTNRTLNTAIHEPAHAMGQASRKKMDGTNNTHYDPAGGGHCHNLSNGCVMYNNNSTSTSFCPVCSESLRARNLASLPVHGDTAPYT